MFMLDSCTTALLNAVVSDVDCPTHLDITHYCIVRADLPFGLQAANLIHAANESTPRRMLPGTIAVALNARNADHLAELADQLACAGIAFHIVEECDGERMAIGIEPTTDRDKVRKVLSRLPCVR